MFEFIREAVEKRNKYGWVPFLLKFENGYFYTFNPAIYQHCEIIGEILSDGSVAAATGRTDALRPDTGQFA